MIVVEEMHIKVTPENLRAISGDVEQKIKKVENAFGQLEEVVQRTAAYWEGEGQRKFVQSYEIRSDDYERIFLSFREHIVNLQQIAGIYQEAEKDNTDFSKELLTAVIE